MTTDTETTLSVLITAGTSGAGRMVTRQMVANGYKAAVMTVGQEGAEVIRANGGLPVFADPLRAGEIKGMLQMAQADILVDLAVPMLVGLPFHVDIENTIIARTEAVLEAAKAAGVKLLVFGSHTLLYGEGQHVDESTALKASGSPVIDALKQAEKLVRDSTVPTCILRTGYVYGSYSEDTIALAGVVKGGTTAVASTKKSASWVHEDDLAQAAILAVQHNAAGEIFNIVDDTPASSHDFLASFCKEQGVQLPAGYMSLLGRNYSNRAANALLGLSFSADNAKAKDKLGWQPKYPTQSAGIEQSLLMWRAGLA